MDREGAPLASITGPVCCVGGNCFDNEFTVTAPDGTELGKVVKEKPDSFAEALKHGLCSWRALQLLRLLGAHADARTIHTQFKSYAIVNLCSQNFNCGFARMRELTGDRGPVLRTTIGTRLMPKPSVLCRWALCLWLHLCRCLMHPLLGVI